VSGRTVEFLREHLALDSVTLVGQYGLERLVGDTVVVDQRAAPHTGAVAAAAAEAERIWPGLLVERKGALACTVHWRWAPDLEPDPSALGDLAARHGLAALHGRRACELRPPVAMDKGRALEDLVRLHALRSVVFAGDDRGDLEAFDALDRLRADETLDHAVRVGVRSDEAPPELLERADLVVDGPAGVAALLRSLARP
jgi:trehalose 6-phosphate phosphatase